MNVVIRLEDLQNRARAACLDFGGVASPEALRMLCGDAAVVPIVMNGKGQPLDVSKRVLWSRQLTAAQANDYTVEKILGGTDKWDPATVIATATAN